jgi:hypothetical protein
VDYTMSEPTLTVEQLDAASPDTAVAPSSTDDSFNWPLVVAAVGGVLILVALVWQVASSRQKPKRPSKPQPQRAASPPEGSPTIARFCHACGAPVLPEDKFCRECGTAVKNR